MSTSIEPIEQIKTIEPIEDVNLDAFYELISYTEYTDKQIEELYKKYTTGELGNRLKLFNFVKNFYKLSNLNKDNKYFMNEEKYKPIVDIFHKFAKDLLQLDIPTRKSSVSYEDGINATVYNLSWIMQKARSRPDYYKIDANPDLDEDTVKQLMYCEKDKPYDPENENALSGMVMIYAFYYKEKPEDLTNVENKYEADTFSYCLYPLNMYPNEARNMGLGIDKYVENSENIKYKFVVYKSFYITDFCLKFGFFN